MIDTLIWKLSDLIRAVGEEQVESLLQGFDCKEEDPNSFIRQKAIDCEKRHICRTYLVLDTDKYRKGELALVAYFSISIIVMELFKGVDVQLSDGGSDEGDARDLEPAYLIAQLARNRKMYSHDDFDGLGLLSAAEEVIVALGHMVGGDLIQLECKDALSSYYSEQGYEEFDCQDGVHRLVKGIPY